jgi:sigma-B regulation protein RsbU (phosphoserine phosphatase)
MILFVLGGTLLVFAVVLGDDYLSSRESVLRQAEDNARHLAAFMANRIEQEFRAVAKVPTGLALALEHGHWDQGQLLSLLHDSVARNKEVYGSTVAYEPYAFNPLIKSYAPYFYESTTGIKFVQLGTDQYNYFQWDWYRNPRDLKRATWSEPFFDEGGGGIMMCTYSVPFYRKSSQGEPPVFNGIVTADISLDWLTRLISSTYIARSGFGLVVSHQGVFISHPDSKLILKETIFGLAEQTRDKSLAALSRDMVSGISGVVKHDSALTKTPAYLAYTPIPSTGWSLAVVLPETDLLSDLHDLNHRTLGVAGLGLVMLLLVVIVIARSITDPLRRMAQATRRIAEGELDVNLADLVGNDEVGELARSFSKMSRDLRKYIEKLTETTAAKERIESELNIASQIQKSILPSTFPPFPDRVEFDLFAVMQPAREVGGDFYDFFLLDDERLALVMADVSDKGVPAALFMMISRTLIKSIARRGKSPEAVLAEANDLLCQGNDAAMFVTVFLAYYEVSTGRLVYANGGHNPAFVVNQDGRSREFTSRGGPALGFMPDLNYVSGQEIVGPGETLVMYTDGVTEAMSAHQELFGLERFKEFVAANRRLELVDLCGATVRVLDEYQEGQQFDDVTLMILRRDT